MRNSSLFLALFLYSRREIAGDWGRLKIHDLEEMPCIDPIALDANAIERIGRVLDKMRTIQLPPIPEQVGMPLRRELDEAIAQALEIPDPHAFLRQLYSSLEIQIAKLY